MKAAGGKKLAVAWIALVALALGLCAFGRGFSKLAQSALGNMPGAALAQGPADQGDTSAVKPTEEDLKAKEQDLERIRRELDQRRKDAAEVAGREQNIATEVDDINKEIQTNQDLLSKLNEKKAVLLEDLGYAEADLAEAQDSLGAASDLLEERLRGIYKFGRGEVMEVILTSKTFADLAKRIYYLSVVADHDRGLLTAFERTVETKKVLVDHIESKKAKLDETEAEVTQEAQNLAARKQERDALLARLKDKRSYYENMARDLQEASRNLEEVLGKLEAGRGETGTGGASFAAMMGRLVWPCEGTVISSFGVETQPKFGTIIKNNGLDIKASAGARIRAVAAGAVSYAGSLTGFGNAVIVDHGGGYYTLYGRLESVVVATGDEVAEGDAIGFIGETSAPEGAVLHFEIRQGKKPLDPQAWLLK